MHVFSASLPHDAEMSACGQVSEGRNTGNCGSRQGLAWVCAEASVFQRPLYAGLLPGTVFRYVANREEFSGSVWRQVMLLQRAAEENAMELREERIRLNCYQKGTGSGVCLLQGGI